MNYTASLDAPENMVRALADRIADDGVLGERSIDLHEAGPDRWRLVVYFVDEPEREELAALRRLAAEAGAARFAVAELPETDWVAKSLAGLKPVRAGRFLIHGAHDRVAARPNDIGILIEAGQAFGTGHHGTTAGCLLAIDRVAKTRPVRHALDLGTGSGVLAIAIAKRCHARVLASDIDPVAVTVARENVLLNGAAGFIETILANGMADRRFRARAPFDLIVANILAGPLVGLAPPIRAALGRGGMLILSGLLPEQRARITSAYRGQGLKLVRWDVLDGWLTMMFHRR